MCACVCVCVCVWTFEDRAWNEFLAMHGAIHSTFYQGMAKEEPGRIGAVKVPAAVACLNDNPLQISSVTTL